MVIYLSLFKGITVFCLSIFCLSVFSQSTCRTSKSCCSSGKALFQCLLYELWLSAWPKVTESKLLSGFQIQTLKGHHLLQHWKRRKILCRNLWKPSSQRDFQKTKPACMLWDAKGFMEFKGALNGTWLFVATPPLKQHHPFYICHLALEEPNVPQRLSHWGQQI